MKQIILLFFLINSISFSKEFKDAFDLIESYKRMGFTINGNLKVEMFRFLTSVYPHFKKFIETESTIKTNHTIISFVDEILSLKILIVNDHITLNVPEKEDLLFDINRYKKAMRIYTFLNENKIKSTFSETNFEYMEKFISIYNNDSLFKGTSIGRISFENILYPQAALDAGSNFNIILPLGNSGLYWDKVLSTLPGSLFVPNATKELSIEIGKKTPVSSNELYKIITTHSGLFKNTRDNTSLTEIKFKSNLSSLLERELPAHVNSQELITAIDNIPYRANYGNNLKNRLMDELKKNGGDYLKSLNAPYLTPLRAKTIKKITSIFIANKDLRTINLSEISFESGITQPVALFDKNSKSYVLKLSDFVTTTNLYTELKKIPIK